jgi:predicted nucleotidyltransferase
MGGIAGIYKTNALMKKDNDMTITKSALSRKEQLLLKEFKNLLLKSFPGEIIEIRMFGSRARGQATAESDLDVLIVTRNEDYHLSDRIIDLSCDLLLKHQIYISPKVISQRHYDQLEAMDSDFLYQVKQEGILL